MEKSKTADDEAPISGVFKRLYDVSSYTGVYKERFKSGDGRINSHSSNRAGKGFQGNTNTGTDETIHSIAQVGARGITVMYLYVGVGRLTLSGHWNRS